MSAPCPVFGFLVTVRLASPGDAGAVVHDLMATLDRNGLTATGGHGALDYVVRREGSQTTDDDRDRLREWADRWAGRVTVAVGDLIDLNPAA